MNNEFIWVILLQAKVGKTTSKRIEDNLRFKLVCNDKKDELASIA